MFGGDLRRDGLHTTPILMTTQKDVRREGRRPLNRALEKTRARMAGEKGGGHADSPNSPDERTCFAKSAAAASFACCTRTPHTAKVPTNDRAGVHTAKRKHRKGVVSVMRRE